MIKFRVLLIPALCLAASTRENVGIEQSLQTQHSGATSSAAAVTATLCAGAGAGGGGGGACAPAGDCDDKCQCEKLTAYFYDETTESCVRSADTKEVRVEKYNNEEKIRREADRVFRGVIGSAILFITCTVVCVVAACFYCCRMNHTDRKLKGNVHALAKKQGRTLPRAPPARPAPLRPPTADNCTVLIEDAGVCVM